MLPAHHESDLDVHQQQNHGELIKQLAPKQQSQLSGSLLVISGDHNPENFPHT
jgi:hypothetical protein